VRDDRASRPPSGESITRRVPPFQLSEIDSRAATGRGRELATRLVLANADRLQRLCADATTALYDGDEAALPALATVWKGSERFPRWTQVHAYGRA
jgi:hypothetical protein